jgi:hypothetical protein
MRRCVPAHASQLSEWEGVRRGHGSWVNA